jgi:hypothetical protein
MATTDRTITVALPSGQHITFGARAVVIGREKGCQIVLPEEAIRPRHAKLSRIAGRWLIEALGDWLLQVGSQTPARKQWLEPGDSIRLAEGGPVIIFEPCEAAPPAQTPRGSAAGAEELEVLPSNRDAWTPVEGPLWPVAGPEGIASPSSAGANTEEPLPAAADCWPEYMYEESSPPPAVPLVNGAGPSIQFFGQGTILIGMGTVTFSGKHTIESGPSKRGSLIVPLSDIVDVEVAGRRIWLSVWHEEGVIPLTLDAQDPQQATVMAAALMPDELSEMQRQRTEAAGHPVAIDPAPPRCFVVVFDPD